MPDPGHELPDSKFWREDQRIKAPDDTLFPYHPAQLPESINPAFKVWHAGLEALALIVIQRNLEIVMYPHLIKDAQIRHYGPRVLGPENNYPGVLEGYIDFFPAERVVPDAVPFRQTVKEPPGIKGRDVG